MESVGVRELRQHASKVLDRVKAGETIAITDRGRPVARICPEPGEEWSGLIEAGAIRPPVSSRRPEQIEPIESGMSGSRILRELRQDDR